MNSRPIRRLTSWAPKICFLYVLTANPLVTAQPICDAMQNSGGEVTADLQVLTRPMGVSPETVYFSAQQSADSSCLDYTGGDNMEACRTGQYLGYHFDFDDPDAGFFETTGQSKNRQISGAPRAAHTFTCDGAGNSQWNAVTEQCEFAVKVRVENPLGDWADACVPVTIKPQHIEYSPAETYCISSDGDFTECPEGVPKSQQLTNSPIQINGFNRSHRRILYQRGSSGIYDPLCLRYDEHNIRVDAYGTGSDPVIGLMSLGTAAGCSDHIPTSGQVAAYPVLSKDSNGHINQGWHYGNSVSHLRVGEIDLGMSVTLLTLHDLDMDWSEGGAYTGGVSLNSAGANCYNNMDLDCALVAHPYGVFVSEVHSHGNNEEGNLPGVNFGCFNDCGLINSAFLGSYGKTAIEHNLRIMGAWGLVISNSHMAGEHIGGNGPKSKITLRQIQTDQNASLITNPENFVDGNHAGTGPGWQRDPDVTHHFSPHYNFLIDNVLGDDFQVPLTDDANWLGLHPGHQYSGVFGTTFLFSPGADTNAAQMALGGRHITTHQTTFNGQNVTCRFRPRGYANPSDYFDSSLIFSDSPDGACNGENRVLPSPAAPGVYSDLIFADGFE